MAQIGRNWPKIVLTFFLGPIKYLFINNEFSMVSQKNRQPTMTLRFKKTIYEGFTVESKLAFFGLPKKSRFSRPIFDLT
jgi:hypothetical protein